MSDDGDFIFDTTQFLTKKAVQTFNIPLVNSGDILLSFKLTLGRVGIAQSNMVTNEAIACIKVDDEWRLYIYCFLKNYDFNSRMESTSSIGKAFNSKLLKRLEFVSPSKTQLTDFNNKLMPLLTIMLYLYKQKRFLNNAKQKLLQKYF